MRKRTTMQAAIEAQNRGDRLPPHLEAETERDAKAAEELHSEMHQFLLAWHTKHPDIEDAIEPVLLRVLAVRMIARGASVEDVADYARAAAKCFEAEGRALRAMASRGGTS